MGFEDVGQTHDIRVLIARFILALVCTSWVHFSSSIVTTASPEISPWPALQADVSTNGPGTPRLRHKSRHKQVANARASLRVRLPLSRPHKCPCEKGVRTPANVAPVELSASKWWGRNPLKVLQNYARANSCPRLEKRAFDAVSASAP